MKSIFSFALLLLLVVGVSRGDTRPKDFGRQWTRSHPLATMGVTIMNKSVVGKKPFDLAQYQAQNYSFLLAWKSRPALYKEASLTGYPWLLHLRSMGKSPSEDFKQKTRQIMTEYPGNVGLLFNDEPSRHGRFRDGKQITYDFDGTAAAVQWVRKTWPEKLVLSNIFPAGAEGKDYYGTPPNPTPEQQKEVKNYGYSEYVADYMEIVKPDVLMFDGYIFQYGAGNETGVTDIWYQSLWLIRSAALKAGVPYWAWMSTWDHPAESGYNVRLPSESDYRMNVFSVLTYGFTGIADFTYCGIHKRDILMPDGTPSPLFKPAAQVHREISNIGKSLRFLTSTHIACIPSSEQNTIPTFLKKWAPGAGDDDRITSIGVVEPGEHVSGKKGLIGYFRDDDGDKYFMLTNLFQRAETAAKDCALTFQITFDPSTKEVYRLSRQTGHVERLEITDSQEGLHITLPGGTGDLFKYENPHFPGRR